MRRLDLPRARVGQAEPQEGDRRARELAGKGPGYGGRRYLDGKGELRGRQHGEGGLLGARSAVAVAVTVPSAAPVAVASAASAAASSSAAADDRRQRGRGEVRRFVESFVVRVDVRWVRRRAPERFAGRGRA